MPYVSFPNPNDGVILKHEKEKNNAKTSNDNSNADHSNADNSNADNSNADHTNINTDGNVNNVRHGKRNLSFIHVHKTGGTTMVTAMRDLIVIDDTHTDTHTGDGNSVDSIVGIEGSSTKSTNTGVNSNSNANANANMDTNNNTNDNNQYTGSFNIYTQF